MIENGRLTKDAKGKYRIAAQTRKWELTVFTEYSGKEVFVRETGWEVNAPTQKSENVKKTYYVFHYVVSGCGYYTIGDKTYKINAFTGFILPPDINLTYWADEEEPWQYYWVGMSGALVAEIVSNMKIGEDNNYIFTVTRRDEFLKTLERLCRGSQKFHNREIAYLFALGGLYEILAYLVDDAFSIKEKGEKLEDRIVRYVDKNYRTTSVGELSKVFYLDRSYIYKLFKKRVGISACGYILDLKLREALVLLEDGDLSVGEIAAKTGFNSCVNFCTQFKKRYGKSPGTWRKRTQNSGK